jgi:peptide/nickel transport system substrate-binding protein
LVKGQLVESFVPVSSDNLRRREMQRKLFNLVIALTLLLALTPGLAIAAPWGQEETVYTVQKDDSLWVIAEKYLGSGATYGAIAVATNARHEADSSFARIDTPSLIQPGWKILVPSAEEAAKLVEEWAAQALTVGGELIVGYDIEPESLDIHVGERDQLPAIMGNVFDTLLVKAPDGSFQPGLATSWEVSADGLSYTFHLRQGVKFHDGTPFNAEAVKFNFERILDPAIESRWAIQLVGPYDSSEVVDEYTFRVKLKEPYGPFLEALTQAFLGMVSPTAVTKWGDEYYLHQTGTGPFIFKEYVPKDHLTLERNPDYNWAPAAYQHQGLAYLDRMLFRFIPESATRLGTVETGETHLIHNVPPRDVAILQANPSLQVYINPTSGRARHYTLNIERDPTSELAVRRALNVAIDREQIVKTLFGDVYSPAYGHLAPKTLFYDPELEKEFGQKYAHDPARAAKLLEEAGWIMGADGIRYKDGKPLKLLLVAASQREVHELVQAQLKQVGFDVEFQMPAVPAFFEACGKGEANLCFLGGMSPPDPGLWMRGFFGLDGQYNWSRHSNTQLDNLLNEGVKTVDQAKRQEIYSQASRIIRDEALTLPVYYEKDIFVARTEVKNLTFDAFADPVLYDVYIEK